ncbi:hypothetical protein Peur_018811 [Populus x canadensis]
MAFNSAFWNLSVGNEESIETYCLCDYLAYVYHAVDGAVSYPTGRWPVWPSYRNPICPVNLKSAPSHTPRSRSFLDPKPVAKNRIRGDNHGRRRRISLAKQKLDFIILSQQDHALG